MASWNLAAVHSLAFILHSLAVRFKDEEKQIQRGVIGQDVAVRHVG